MTVESTVDCRRRSKNRTRKSECQERRSGSRSQGTSQVLLATWKDTASQSSSEIPPCFVESLIPKPILSTGLAMSGNEFGGKRYDYRRLAQTVIFMLTSASNVNPLIFAGTNQANWREFQEIDEIRRADPELSTLSIYTVSRKGVQVTTACWAYWARYILTCSLNDVNDGKDGEKENGTWRAYEANTLGQRKTRENAERGNKGMKSPLYPHKNNRTWSSVWQYIAWNQSNAATLAKEGWAISSQPA